MILFHIALNFLSQKCPQIQDFGVAAWFRLYSVLAKQKKIDYSKAFRYTVLG